ncbi:MAG: hypothetical protein AB7K09_04045 [Planctomycetota bacterium]
MGITRIRPRIIALAALFATVACTAVLSIAKDDDTPAPPVPPADGRGGQVTDVTTWDGKLATVHEWGTFTSLQGSDGSTLDGLRHEERDLPAFVYDIRDKHGVTGIAPKMETPVIYFYSPTAARAEVSVKFPHGAITQWYPAASRVNHVPLDNMGVPTATDGHTIRDLRDGFIEWGTREQSSTELLVMGRDESPALPVVGSDDPWRFSRMVDANTVRVCNLNAWRTRNGSGHERNAAVQKEYERFLFYRGLGNFPLPLRGRVTSESVTAQDEYRASMSLSNVRPDEPLRAVFVIRVIGGKAGFHYVGNLKDATGQLDVRFTLRPLAESTGQLVEKLAACLTETGLFHKEALAMARTWQHGYFREDGLRVLYVLPDAFMDRELPLAVTLRSLDFGRALPLRMVRTFVGRTELLSPEQEAELMDTVTKLATGDANERLVAGKTIDRWGRFAIPYLHRAKALAEDRGEVVAEIDRLLAAHDLKR